MFLNQNALKVLQYFFDNPYEEIHLRELARKTGVSIFSVKSIVDYLTSINVLVERRVGRMRYLKANLENLFFKYLKIAFTIKKILDSKLVEYLVETIPGVSSIVLFGSAARGEDDAKSDLDLLIIGQPKPLELSRFERELKREVKPIVFKWSQWKREARENKPFYLEVITSGICLYGSLPVVD